MYRLHNQSFFKTLINDTSAFVHRIRLRRWAITICTSAFLMLAMHRPAFAQSPPKGEIEIVFDTGKYTLNTREGETSDFYVHLSTAPSENVTVTISKTNADVTLSATTLTFTPSEWSLDDKQKVTITVADDDDQEHDSDTFTFSASGGIDAPDVTESMSIPDSAVGWEANVDKVTITEGTMVTFNLRLTIQPKDGVFGVATNIGLSSSSVFIDTDSDTTGYQTTLNISRDDWDTYKTITVTANEDDNQADEMLSIDLTANRGSGRWETARMAIPVEVIDNDKPPAGMIEVTPAGALSIEEGDSTGATFSVKLSVKPNANVTVTPSNTNDDVTISPASLMFTGGDDGNWDTAQNFTVTAGEDDDGDSDTDTITFSATGGITASDVTRMVNITDNDAPSGAIEVTPAGTLTIGEDSSTNISVKLSAQPNANVTVTLSNTNSDVTFSGDDLTNSELTFTTSNYSTAQTVTVSVGEDADANDETDTITFSATGGIAASNVTRALSITDNDNPSGTIEVTPAGTLDIDEGDATGGTLSVKLSVAPKSNVTVSLSKTNDDVSLSSTSLTFTTSNYSTAQTVTVTAADDADATNETDTITFSATGGIDASNVTKAVAIVDDDFPPGTIVVTPSGTLTIGEGGSKSLMVSLSVAPNADVTVSLSKTNDDVTLSATSLTFTTSNYSTAQSVSVSAGQDDDNTHETDTITFSATGGINASNVTKGVTITDDEADPPPNGRIVLSLTETLLIDEGGSGTFTVRLSRTPDANVTVSLSKTNMDVSLAPVSLTFTVTNWSAAQTITVTAAEDDDMASEFDTITLEASGGIIASPKRKDVFITDNDRNPSGTIILSDERLPPIAEGDSVSIEISLSAAPEGSAMLSLSSDMPALVASPSSLTFTPSNHSNPQSVMLMAQEDDDALDEVALITIEAKGGIDAPALKRSFLIIDDDKPPTLPPGDAYGGTIVVTPEGGLSIDEEGEGTIEVRLATLPAKNVSILITKTRFGIGISRGSMTFTPSNWNKNQSVKILAHADSDKDDSVHFVTFAFEDKRIIREVFVTDNDKELPRTQALALPPVGSEDEATLRIQCKQATPCHVALDCSTQVDGLVLEGTLPEPIPAYGAVSLTSREIQRYTGGNSWAGRGRLGCTLRSSENLGSQVWTRSGNGVLVNNSAMIRSEMEGDVYRADIESIPSPDAFDESNIRIRCNSDLGHCLDTVFVCYSDDGTRYVWESGQIDRRTTRHLQSEELATGIGYRWPGLGLSCELRSQAMFTVQVLTRTGGGGALVNNSATGER